MAVIGAGHRGKHHGRLLAGLDGAELTAVVDTDAQRASAAAGGSGARAISDYRELFGEGDAVIVAGPTPVPPQNPLALPAPRGSLHPQNAIPGTNTDAGPRLSPPKR